MKILRRVYYQAIVTGFFDDCFCLRYLTVTQKNALNYNETISAVVTDYHETLGGYFAKAKENIPLFIQTEQKLSIGQRVSVQIIKEARENKAATGVLCEKSNIESPKNEQIENTDIINTALIETALAKEISFAEGAMLHFEKTAVCSVFDVDSAKSTQPLDKINEAACTEIAKQVRLKNLSGIILIDFAGFKKAAEQKKLHALLKKAFREDSLTHLGAFTKTRLFELTRKRQAASLFDVFLTPAGEKNALFLSLEIQERLEQKWRTMPVLTVHPVLAHQLPREFQNLCFMKTDLTYPLNKYELKEENNGK